ncbi:type IV pilus modification PilV family protein [Desulfosporosinus youngiae]|uniref:Prepilin-type N-terminal cleavage/methylation domain-containing protein n=1 Tax=Desulfosporosinus youngiae DSM 17734 TaxID=768710 RepID=H5XSH2_9FIRM|nr:hypothetical protein [Desulfosporosinus youngiae]EHQ88072.1 hypothetical protein DesyoDRAFT_0900 [Desulfosporosinus youngiae DSM 17734]
MGDHKEGVIIPNKNFVPRNGYILFDVLLALVLFSLGFAVLFGLSMGAVSEARQAASLMEGANLAQKTMDRLAANVCIPGGTAEGREGKFQWLIHSEWQDIPELLKVSVEVRWMDRGNPHRYKLESLYAVE